MHELLDTLQGRSLVENAEERGYVEPAELEALQVELDLGDEEIADFARATVEQIGALDKEKLRPERAELGLCPRCGAETGEIIRENRFGFGCTSWKSKEEPGCGFVIWKRVAGRTLTPEIVRQLIEEGRTREVLRGFKSRSKRTFSARLVLAEDGKVEFQFPERAATAAQAASDSE